MLKQTILSLCAIIGGLATTSHAIAQTERERPDWLPKPKSDHFRPIELSVEMFKPFAAAVFGRDLYIQSGVAYRFQDNRRVRLELGYAQCFRDTIRINIMHSARGSFARLYYAWDINHFIQIYGGLQGGAYEEKFDVELLGNSFENYSTQASFKEQYLGLLGGVAVLHNIQPWLGVRAYAQSGVYTFNSGERLSPENFSRTLVIGNGVPLNYGTNSYFSLSVGVELLFYF